MKTKSSFRSKRLLFKQNKDSSGIKWKDLDKPENSRKLSWT